MNAFERLCELRWPDGVICPYCGSSDYYMHTANLKLGCASPPCRRQFTPTSGTTFSNRKLSPDRLLTLIDRFPAFSNASDLMRATGVTYKTALSLWHRLSATGGRLA